MKTNMEITLLLVEAQRGLNAAQAALITAIEEMNAPVPPPERPDHRDEVANLAVAKAIEMNTDFTLYARRAIVALLDRTAPDPVRAVPEGVPA